VRDEEKIEEQIQQLVKANEALRAQIAEHKRTEEQLRLREERLVGIIETIASGITIVDREGYFLFVNAAAERILGLSRNELINRSYRDPAWKRSTVDGKPLPEQDHPFVRVMKAGQPVYNVEYSVERPDGTRVIISVNAAPLRDAEGAITGVVSSITDITERKRVEEELRRKQLELTDFFENAVIGLLWIGPEGYILRANRAQLDLLGYAPEEYIGHHIAEFHVDPETPGDILQRLARNETLRNYEARLRRKDGSVKQVLIDSNVLREDGKFTHARCFIRDITERKRAEEQLRRQNEYLIALHDTTLQLMNRLEVDSVLEAIVARAAALINTPHGFIRLIKPGDVETLQRVGIGIYSAFANSRIKVSEGLVGRVLQTGQLLMVDDYRTWPDRLPDPARDIFHAVIGVPLKSGTEVIGVLGLAHLEEGRTFGNNEIELLNRFAALASIALDNARLYTAVQQELAERRRAEAQLKESLKEKEVLLKEIHHRVKNNLQIISSLLDLQSDYVQDPKALELFKESQNRVKSMALIHEKLYQSKNLAQTDFAEYIRDLTAHLFESYRVSSDTISLRMRLKSAPIGIDTAIPCGLIINELISNSLRHAFPKGRRGEIRIDLHPDREDTFILVIRDNGVGFPEDLDFRNTESLGLQLVTSLIKQLNGTIELDKNAGTTFKITFPQLGADRT